MAMTVRCHCGKVLDVADEQQGNAAQCPWCGNTFVAGAAVHSTTALQAEEPSASVPQNEIAPAQIARSGLPDVNSIAHPWRIHPIGWAAILVCAACVGVVGLGYFLAGPMGGGTTGADVANSQVKGTLSIACQAFFAKHQRWPENLAELTLQGRPDGPFVEPDAIIDPWKRPYQYDPKGPMNEGRRPDIWTVSPDGTIIGNWPRERN